ncbi:MAG TPA: adenylate kinase [Pirellulales bacterium]|jgi:adenylate kinase
MRLVMLGPPGSGKGTQSERLAAQLKLVHLSTGEMLRQAIAKGEAVGLEAKKFIDAGQLVPSGVMIDLVVERLGHPDCAAGCLLDGFPRTIDQAQALDAYLARQGTPLDGVLELDVHEDELLTRMIARGRGDDKPEVIRQRMAAYHAQTKPLSDYYRAQGKLVTIDALGSIDEIFMRLMDTVHQLNARSGIGSAAVD